MRNLNRFLIGSSIVLAAAAAQCDTSSFTITDDSSLNSIVASARSSFLANRPSTSFNQLDVVLLVPNANGTWRRGSYNANSLTYPASTVKLGYLAAAMYWCRTHGHAYNYLDSSVGPMIRVSDNYQTGVVVDTITGAPNITDCNSTSDPRFLPWYNKRIYTENFLGSHGLLENQTMMNKTYPSNSNLEGAEYVNIYDYRGGNLMQPKCAASLMLEINRGAIESGANSYMRDLLTHDRFGAYGPLGFGLPPGTTYENKLGNAYDNLNDIAYIKLPNGKEMILACYSNGYEESIPSPYDVSGLGPFAETLIEDLGYDVGNPAKIKVDNNASGVVYTGSWSTGTGSRDKFGTNYRYKSKGSGSASVKWNLNVPTTGLYEVCVWFPQGTNRATDAPYTVNHAAGASLVHVNQQNKGGRWVKLGDYNINAGSGSVVLTDAISNSTKVVLADCVKATLFPVASSDIIVDNSDPGFSASSNWATGTSAGDKYGPDYRFRSTAPVSDPATWSYTAPTTRNYEVFAWWSSGANRSPSAPYILTRNGGSTTVVKNQQVQGGSFQSLGTYSINAGSNSVMLSCWTGSGYVVIADAVKISPR
jgi:beta-lactamase class A